MELLKGIGLQIYQDEEHPVLDKGKTLVFLL